VVKRWNLCGFPYNTSVTILCGRITKYNNFIAPTAHKFRTTNEKKHRAIEVADKGASGFEMVRNTGFCRRTGENTSTKRV
jgi:hypothetical protein